MRSDLPLCQSHGGRRFVEGKSSRVRPNRREGQVAQYTAVIVKARRMEHIVMESRMEPSPCGGWNYGVTEWSEHGVGYEGLALRAVVRVPVTAGVPAREGWRPCDA
jgi:hypothetical protein